MAADGPATTTFAYTLTGLVSRITLPDGPYLDYTYDNAHRLTRITASNGDYIDYTLDAAGNRTQETVRVSGGAIVRTQSRVFDELGRLIRSIGASSQAIAYSYDVNSNLTSVTDPLTHATAFAFDALDRLITTTNAAAGVSQNAWDTQDNQTGFTDAGSVTTGLIYDGFGQVIQEASPDGGTVVLERDAAGNVTQRTDGRGVVEQATYDALDRQLTRTYPTQPAQDVAWSYDQPAATYGVGRLTGWTDASGSTSLVYDARGNITESTRVIGGVSYVTQYSWTLADQLAAMTYPGGRIVSYARDAMGRVTSVSQRDSLLGTPRTVVDTLTWEPFGPLADLRHANNISTAYTYDQDGRLDRILSTGSGSTFLDLTLTWDNADNITAVTDGRLPALNQSFTYDVLDRLTAASGAYGSWTWGYDANSNRTSRARAGGLAETYTTTSGSNRLAQVDDGTVIRSFTYDGSGAVTGDDRGPAQVFTYLYNATGRLGEVQLAGQTWAQYGLNALGERVSKTIPGSPAQVTHFHYDLGGRLIAETDGTGAILREYIWLDDLPLMARIGAGEYAVLPDQLGTPHRLVDASGTVVWDAVWRPFGEIESLGATVTFPLRLPGQYFDAETGLHYNYMRDYDPALGRYIQSDPIGLAGGSNRYEYVGGNPITRVDPTGEIAPLVVLALGGAAALSTWLYPQPANAPTKSTDPTFPRNDLAPVVAGLIFAVPVEAAGSLCVRWAEPGLGKIVARLTGRRPAPPASRLPINANEAKRIQNAADRIDKPISLVGSRAEGTARPTSDWDYVIEELTKREKDKIKNSLPGAPNRADQIPRRIDFFRESLDPNRPYITFAPRAD